MDLVNRLVSKSVPGSPISRTRLVKNTGSTWATLVTAKYRQSIGPFGHTCSTGHLQNTPSIALAMPLKSDVKPREFRLLNLPCVQHLQVACYSMDLGLEVTVYNLTARERSPQLRRLPLCQWGWRISVAAQAPDSSMTTTNPLPPKSITLPPPINRAKLTRRSPV